MDYSIRNKTRAAIVKFYLNLSRAKFVCFARILTAYAITSSFVISGS